MGGQKLTGQLGEDFREYLVSRIGRGKRGSADLCSYFLLRDLSVAREGRVGIIATNTIAQGDTREVGLDQAVDIGWSLYRAEKSQPWPGTAALEVSLVWAGHPGQREPLTLDGGRVTGIAPSLDPQPRIRGNPRRLAAASGQSFQGSIVLGKGFILEPGEAQALLTKDPRNKAVLFPYLNGEDLNSRWDCSASRWVINFHDWSEAEAAAYPECYERVLRLVRAEREANTYSKHARKNWWRYERSRPELYTAIANLDRVLVIAQTSRTQIQVLVLPGQVFDQKLVVFPSRLFTDLSFRTSAFQYCWTVRQSSTMKADTVYAPSDCCDTLPKPTFTQRLTNAGKELDEFRHGVMGRRRIGLTALYRLMRWMRSVNRRSASTKPESRRHRCRPGGRSILGTAFIRLDRVCGLRSVCRRGTTCSTNCSH